MPIACSARAGTMCAMRAAIVWCLCACSPEDPARAAAQTPLIVSVVPVASGSSVGSTAAAPPPSASAAGAPASICELAKGSYGAWQPTLDEVVAAAKLLPHQCFSPEHREPILRACSAKLGAVTVKVGLGSLDEEATCEESYLPASWNGRRWIVLEVDSFSVVGAVATGSAFAVELRGGAKPMRYLDNEGLAECGRAGAAASGPPADFPQLPPDLAKYLCGLR